MDDGFVSYEQPGSSSEDLWSKNVNILNKGKQKQNDTPNDDLSALNISIQNLLVEIRQMKGTMQAIDMKLKIVLRGQKAIEQMLSIISGSP